MRIPVVAQRPTWGRFLLYTVCGLVALAVTIGALWWYKERNQLRILTAGGARSMSELNAGVTGPTGDFRVKISIKYPDGASAAGLPYRLELPRSGSQLKAATGVLTQTGEAIIGGLAGGEPPVIYYLYVKDAFVGLVSVASNRDANRFSFLLPAKEQMQSPELSLIDVETGEKFRLSDLRGQIVFLEFYTTQCAPCQPALAKLNDLLAKRGAEWRGKATILSVGLDAVIQPDRSADVVARHLRRQGWEFLRPLVPDQPFSWEGTKRLPFGIVGFPHAFLIGQDGIILWSGYPDAAEIERRIEELLNKQ